MCVLKNKNIVLIADPVEDHFNCTQENDDLECPSMEYFHDVLSALQKVCAEVIWYKSPKDFMDQIGRHKEDLVVSIWSGTNSIYRKSFVSAICEAYGIKYMGPDPFVQLLCQDKHLSKLYCHEFGIEGAREVHIKSENTFEQMKSLTFPLIIKPNSEGGSNGISQKNVVYNYNDAVQLCNELFPVFNHDLLAEEYLPGTEITVILAGVDSHNFLLKQNEIVLKNNIQNQIWGLESKKQEKIDTPIVPIDILDHATKEKFIALFSSFKKVELLRIDGRVHNGVFRLIELTPDVSLEVIGSATVAFSQAGISYPEMFEVLLGNTLRASANAS